MSAVAVESKSDNLPPGVRFDDELVREANKSDKAGTLTHRIMMLVAYKSYAQATTELTEHIKLRAENFMALYLASHRYVLRCQTLVTAIEKKRGIPNLELQSASKQQEIFDLIKEYFKELRMQLKGIENIERTLIIEDVRSTVWAVRTLFYCIIAVMVVGFMLDISTGSLATVINVARDYMSQFCGWLLDFFFKN